MSRKSRSLDLFAATIQQEKSEYAKRLVEGLATDKTTVMPDFSLLPETIFNKTNNNIQAVINQTFYQLSRLIRVAILEGNFDKLQAYLGPAIYPRHQRDNRQIHQLRWSWVNAKEKMEAYAQLFNIVLWYGRKAACEEYIAATLRTAKIDLQTLEAAVDEQENIDPARVFRSHLNPDEWILLSNNAGYLKKTSSQSFSPAYPSYPAYESLFLRPKKQSDKKTLEEISEHRKKLVLLENYFRQYHAANRAQAQREPVSLEESLTVFFQMLEARYPQETLNAWYASVANQKTLLTLSKQESTKIKNALKACLYTLPKKKGSHIAALVQQTFEPNIQMNSDYQEQKEEQPKKVAPYSTETVLTLVSPITFRTVYNQVCHYAFTCPEIQSVITAHIDKIFDTTNHLAKILNAFYVAWKEQYDQLQHLEERYRYLVNNNCHQAQQQELVDAFTNLAAVKVLEQHKRNEIEIINESSLIKAKQIIQSQIGAISLSHLTIDHEDILMQAPNLAISLLTIALAQCDRPQLSAQEKEKRLLIAACLVRRGCSPFLLPMFADISEEPNQIVSSKPMPWQILIAILDTLVCITPAAEAIRQEVLAYAETENDHKDDKIGLHRRQAVTRIAWLLYESQNPNKLDEKQLLAIIADQIEKSPRRWFRSSKLYKRLQAIIDRVHTGRLMTIQEEPGIVLAHGCEMTTISSQSDMIQTTSSYTRFFKQSNEVSELKNGQECSSNEEANISVHGIAESSNEEPSSPLVSVEDVTGNPEYDSDCERRIRKSKELQDNPSLYQFH